MALYVRQAFCPKPLRHPICRLQEQVIIRALLRKAGQPPSLRSNRAVGPVWTYCLCSVPVRGSCTVLLLKVGRMLVGSWQPLVTNREAGRVCEHGLCSKVVPETMVKEGKEQPCGAHSFSFRTELLPGCVVAPSGEHNCVSWEWMVKGLFWCVAIVPGSPACRSLGSR